MRRTHLWAFLLACLPALVVAQSARDRLTLDDYLELETVADPGRFRQSVLNLASNACKFTKDGLISLEAGCETWDGREWITVRVRELGAKHVVPRGAKKITQHQAHVFVVVGQQQITHGSTSTCLVFDVGWKAGVSTRAASNNASTTPLAAKNPAPSPARTPATRDG